MNIDLIKVIASSIIYIMVATLFGEYIISRDCNALLQIGALFGMMLYTVLQLRYVFRYISKLINI